MYSNSPKLQKFCFEVINLNKFGERINCRDSQANYFTESLGNNITMDMIAIPGSIFIMGSPNGEGNKNERPKHRVKVPSFYLGKYTVTNAQWKIVMGTDLSSITDPRFKIVLGPRRLSMSEFTGDRQPVINVSWKDAQEFCQKLSSLSGRKYRLPSEAEWEYACRAGTTTPFSFGENISAEYVNYDGNYPYKDAPKGEYRQKTTEVGIFSANNFGLYDMHGNVWEWCEDEWHDNYQGAPFNGSAWVNKNENRYSNHRLVRGGSWCVGAGSCRSAYRSALTAEFRLEYMGFRVACSYLYLDGDVSAVTEPDAIPRTTLTPR